MFNAEYSLEKYWQGPKSLEVAERGTILSAMHTLFDYHHSDSALTLAAVRAVLTFQYYVSGGGGKGYYT